MSVDTENKTNLITWKDADQNLCTLAAYMLSEAMKSLRSDRDQTGPVASKDGPVQPGYAAPDGSKRTLFSPQGVFAANYLNDWGHLVPAFQDQAQEEQFNNDLDQLNKDNPDQYGVIEFIAADIKDFLLMVDDNVLGAAADWGAPGTWGLPPLCWWSFQNLIRLRLSEARQELEANLYGEGHGMKWGKFRSRNPNGRKKHESKSGRQPERQ